MPLLSNSGHWTPTDPCYSKYGQETGTISSRQELVKKCKSPGPSPDLQNKNLHFPKISMWVESTWEFEESCLKKKLTVARE